MYKLKYSLKAIKNLSDIENFIAIDNKLYSIEVIKEIKETIDYLKLFPFLGTPYKSKNIRKLVTKKYKYLIIYHIENNQLIKINTIYKYKNIC